jgi:hypothetical protein
VSWNNPALFGKWGLGAAGNIVIPLAEDAIGTRYGAAASLLAGPAFMPLNTGVFMLPITAGLHADWVIPLAGNIKLYGNLGLGVSADAVWQFGAKWHVYGRLELAYNFGSGGEFLLFPGIGMGLKF